MDLLAVAPQALDDCFERAGFFPLAQPPSPVQLFSGARLGPYEFLSLIGAGGLHHEYHLKPIAA
jgi:hypothetical protein